MYSLLRLAHHHHPLALRPCLHTAARRTITSSVFRRAEVTHDDPKPTVNEDESDASESTTVVRGDAESESSADRPAIPTSFKEFMESPQHGKQYEFARPQNWLKPPPREGRESGTPVENVRILSLFINLLLTFVPF